MLNERVAGGINKRLNKELAKQNDKDMWEFLNDEAAVLPFLNRIENLTGIPPAVSVTLILTYLVWNVWIGAYGEFIAICFGTVYPIFKSF